MKGMLWYLSEPKKTPNEQLNEGLEHFRKKYEKVPTIVYAHPSQVEDFQPIDGVNIVPTAVQFNHVLIGVEEEVADGVL